MPRIGDWNVAFEHDLGARRHLQRPLGFADARVDQFGRRAAQQSGELILRQRVRHRSDRAQHGRRIGAQRDRHRKWPTGIARANSRKS